MKSASGINTELGSNCSKIAFGYAQKTFSHRKNKTGNLIPTVAGGYSSALDFNGTRIGISSDGIGTKIEVAERMGKYNTLGYDLLAMTIDDLCCSGFIPAFVSNILDVDVLDSEIVDELMSGLAEAASFSDVIITGGEIAELGNRISGYGNRMHFNWCATGIGMLHPFLNEPITGKDILPGDAILAVYNPGFRSNGYSLIRTILTNEFGDSWHSTKYNDQETWGDKVLAPCLLYSPLIEQLLDNSIALTGIAHITGGGIVDNLGRIIKLNGLGAVLNNLFFPDDAMEQLRRLGNVSLRKAYNYWNMGNGMLITLREKDAEQVLALCRNHPHYKVQKAGNVTEEKVIKINHFDEELIFTEYYNK